MELVFHKMHGIGNDYVYITQEIPNPSEAAKFISDRHFGVGSDGLVMVLPSQTADVRMRMFNSDGSESEMCGNAIRCVAKLAYDKEIVKKDIITVETLAGIKTIWLTIENNKAVLAKVDMGEPIFAPELIPVMPKDVSSGKSHIKEEWNNEKEFIKKTVTVADREFVISCVSMGNPHAVTFVDNVDTFLVHEYGPMLETHPVFPKKSNIEFVQIIDTNRIKMRVWERGAGETLACGTGACASSVICMKLGLVNRSISVDLLGGTLNIEWNENNHVFMTGPATYVFEGKLEI